MERDERSGLTPIPQDRRQTTIDTLVQHYAADNITVDEFERRVDIAHRTRDLTELSRLTSDLPVLAQPQSPAQTPEADRLIRRGAEVLSNAVRESQTHVAIMGGVEIIVPPGLRIESNGMGIMGAFEHVGQPGDAGPGGPVLYMP